VLLDSAFGPSGPNAESIMTSDFGYVSVRTAGRQTANDRLLGYDHAFGLECIRRRFARAAFRG